MMNLMITAHLKQSFENWKKVFDAERGPVSSNAC